VHPKARQLEQVDLMEINGLGIDKTPEKEKRKKISSPMRSQKMVYTNQIR
jgi:hypothetical protein